MKNVEIAKIFQAIAAYLDMEGVPFKPRAYEKAALALESMSEDVADIYKRDGVKGLKGIPGIGESMAQKIAEYLETGKIEYFEELKKKIPVDVAELTAIEGVGPKMAKALYEQLGIRTIDELERAALQGKIRKLPGFGLKKEQRILRGISFYKQASGRFLLGFVIPLVEKIEARLRQLEEVEELAVAGSNRRWKETVGDLDILVVSSNPERVMAEFTSLPEVIYVYAKGPTKSSVKLANRMDVDLRVVPRESFGAALLYFTGSKEHNIQLRNIAIKKGLKLNEYGVFKGEKRIAGETEEEVYAALGLPYIEPELREGAGEIEAAMEGRLPKLISYGSLKGDLQVQTNWTDGAQSIAEMAEAARKAGLSYIVITDHTRSLAMTGGLDEEKLLRQMKEIDALNRKLRGFRILKGAEVNILQDGRLDIADQVLEKLDVVGAAVHSHFAMPRSEMTRRIIRAMQNPHVDILFHPTGRIIQRREPYDVDIDAVIRAAKETGTILEIDAYPERLDMKDEHIRKAVEAGVKMVIDSDAHQASHFGYLRLGIAQARRGWATAGDVLNTKPLEQFLAALKKMKESAVVRHRA